MTRFDTRLRATAISATLLSLVVGCGSDDQPTPDAEFQLVHEGETAALLSVWGSSASDVWVVGGMPEQAAAPTVLHYDGSEWERVDSNQLNVDLWWVFGFSANDVFFSGSSGTILRYRDGAFEKMLTPSASGIVFGMWGVSADDVWAVGDGSENGAILWHFDGDVWTEVARPADMPESMTAFKVHGQASDDVWISCSQGGTLYWDGSELSFEQTATDNALFSVVTTPTRAIAVGGGLGISDLLENEGDGWTAADLTVPVPWRGVAGDGENVWVVGEAGVLAQRDDAGWSVVAQTLTTQNFHAAWIGPEGDVWGVGGRFDVRPLTLDGFILHLGTEPVAEVEP